jgi:carboxypeptidase C (cathepsin A)
MAEEEKRDQTPAVAGPLAGTFALVEPHREAKVPEPASARLAWHGNNGEAMDYVATAGHVDVVDDTGKLVSKMFSVSYVKVDAEGATDPARPVTFCYNGGPGCASVPINFGGMGPRRVQTVAENHIPSNAPTEDNPYTLLRESDLVFLDAPGTGWSSLAADADPSTIFGVDGDADAFSRAISEWLERNNRWQSPLYIFGESYGTVRNAALMRLLGERGVKLTGVVMLSAIWNWVQTLPGEDLYYLGMMPTFAATAQYFGKAGQGVDVDEWFDRAMAWTEDVYAPALLKGDRLGADRGRQVARELAGFIGLDERFILRRHLRVTLEDVRAELLVDEGKVCGRLDMRYVSDAPSPVQLSSDWFAAEDAASDATSAAWDKAFRTFLRDELGYQAPARYLDNNYYRVGVRWDWKHREPGSEEVSAPNMTVDVATALRRDPTMKLCVLGGRYDAATTYWNVVFELSRQFLSPGLRERVVFHRYGCGHMAYTDIPSLTQMSADLEAFYK